MRWLWRDLLRWLSALERVFVDGRVAPAVPPKAGASSAAQQTGSPCQGTSPLVDGSIPDWMRPAPSAVPRKALPMEVVSALMTLGLASPPAKESLKKRLRRALAQAHPDRHPPEDHAQMRQRLHEIQRAREVLRRHGYA